MYDDNSEPGREVSMAELRELWDALKARGELWNGMTGHYLRQRYGDRLYHVTGDGWYVRPGGDRPGTALSGGGWSSLLTPRPAGPDQRYRASTPPAGASSYGGQP